jgi:RNA polymerase sigma-70 factor (ECF subfamily)
MSPLPLEQVIERAQKGDAEAVAALYQTYVQRIFRYILYRVSTAADAEDLTAEVFLKMVEGLPKYRLTGAPFEAWLYRIAVARIVDYRRRMKYRSDMELDETLADTKPLPEEHLQRRQELENLRYALQQLTDEQQTILILRFIERKNHQQVAAILGRSVTAVRTAQHRALVELTALLGSEDKVRHYLRGSHG